MARPDRRHGYFHDLETQTPGERRERELSGLHAILARAWHAGTELKARLRPLGLTLADVQTEEGFAAIPLLRKKDLLARQKRGDRLGGLVACELGRLSRIYQSPGPIYDPEGPGPDYWGWGEAFYAAGFRPRDLVQMTFSYHLTPAGLMLEEPLKAIGCAVIPAGPGNTEVQVELLADLPVTGFVGMASYLAVIADKAEALGLDVKKDVRLEVAFVAAERLPESLRKNLEERLGIMVRQGYGTADVGAIAYECPALTGMHLSSRAYVEIVDPASGHPAAPGEIGEVVVTPFSEVYPLVRLATGDLSRLVDAPCACGRTAPRLAGILGRVDDTAKVKGQFIYPSQAAEVAARFPQITGFQLVVENPGGKDRLTVCLELTGELDREAFCRTFQERCKLKPEVAVLGPGERFESGTPRLVDKRTFD